MEDSLFIFYTFSALSIIQIPAAHGQKGLVEVPAKIAPVPYPLDMTPLQCIGSTMIIGRNILARGFTNNTVAGKTNPA